MQPVSRNVNTVTNEQCHKHNTVPYVIKRGNDAFWCWPLHCAHLEGYLAWKKCHKMTEGHYIIIIISKTMFMVLSSWQSHCESSPGSFDECRIAPSGRQPKTKPDDLGCESACTGCQKLHPPSPFIIITQPESWYSFYRPTEGRRLSRPSCLHTEMVYPSTDGHPSRY